MAADSRHSYILGCPQEDGKIAVLCRSTGKEPGPACCDTKIDAMKLKTNLANDPRGRSNHRALEIIKSLLVYQIDLSTKIDWEAGALWGYLDESIAKCVESSGFWN